MSRRRDEARAERDAAQQALLDIRAQGGELARQLEGLKAEAELAARDAAAALVIPGSGAQAAVAEKTARLTAIETNITNLDRAEREAEARLEAAEEEQRKAVIAEVPGAMEDVGNATEVVRVALADLGEASLELYIRAAAALEKRREALVVVQGLERDLGGDARTVSAQRGNIKRWLRGLLKDASPEEACGYLAHALLTWTRRGSTPLEAAWRERGLPILPGSVLMDRLMLDDDVHALRDGRLPL